MSVSTIITSHINFSPEQHDLLIFAPPAACYLYYCISHHKIEGLLKIREVGTLLNEQTSYIDCRWVTIFRNIQTTFSVGLWR